MLKLRINPLVAADLKEIRDYIAEDNEEYAVKTIDEIYSKFENIQMFPGIGSDLSKRVSFRTDYKYVERLCNYLQSRKRVCGDLQSGESVSGHYEDFYITKTKIWYEKIMRDIIVKRTIPSNR